MSDVECLMLDVGCLMFDFGCGMPDVDMSLEPGIWNYILFDL